MGRAAGSTAGLPDQNTASGYAILHGLVRRTAPQTEGITTRSRASRWPAGGLTDLCGAMSVIVLIASALPPAADILATAGKV